MEGEGNLDTAYADLYRKYSGLVSGFLKNMVHQKEASEDITHDVFTALLEKEEVMDPESRGARKLLLAVARHKAYDYIRKSVRESAKLQEVVLREAVLDGEFYNSIEDMHLEGEVVSTIHDTINSFPELERNIFLEKYFKEISKGKIALRYELSLYRINKIEQKICEKIKNNILILYDETVFDDFRWSGTETGVGPVPEPDYY
ncbi:MAG: sigma-70 family RNA polymerase sigma factor [bacterium]|nr:sigma-70 family RNA polymerase sigma factor [bacterium]